MSPTSSDSHLVGRTVVVTGAAGGFGSRIARFCAERGANVVASDVDLEALSAAGFPDAVVSVASDVTDQAAMFDLTQRAVDEFGALDVMVNNAGTMPLAFFADHASASAAWDRCIDINFKGVLHGIVAAHDHMIRQGRGHVVNLSSIYGNFPVAGSAVYTATKAAVNVLSESLRVESQGRIKVTTIRPTGVPGTGLGDGIINMEALVGITGHHAADFGEHAGEAAGGAHADREAIDYWALSPDDLAEQIVYAIDQPWGVSIAEMTIPRATKPSRFAPLLSDALFFC